MSQADLAERMAELGTPWKRATVVNLEKRGTASRGTGVGRDAVTLQEWLHLAEALNAPPPLLLADPRRTEPVPVAEGVEVSAWEALMWLTGSGTIGRGIASDRRSSVAMDLIWHGRVVAEAAGAIEATRPLDVYRPGTQVRGDALSRDGLGTLDDLHRGHLETIAAALEHIVEELGAPAPQLGPTVLKRAAELGVELPGQDGEG